MLEIRPAVRKNVYANPFRLFDDFDRAFFGSPFGTMNERTAAIRTDITETADGYLLEAELPGFSKEEISLSVDGDMLTISAERKSETEEKDSENRVIRSERRYGSCSRRFDISGVNAEAISAKYEDGILSLTLPKKEEEVPHSRRIDIQ
ncbi:MAG: Hsp20/alpha crystallin family protein [Clostridia bacterium]|nr:Hsp20/alpha crystallin family protein [Clostridia bacterium]